MNTTFKIGDKVECVDASHCYALKIGEIYEFMDYTTAEKYIRVKDKKGEIYYGFRVDRFKLVKPKFQPQYFSALNASEAEQYIGKTMEFADGANVRSPKWEKNILEDVDLADNQPFETLSDWFQFCRTCPETFQKKMVKKTVVGWLNIYDDGEQFFHASKWEANECGKHREKIACVKLTGEYEIEE